jgi:hypothetical protein
MSELTETVLRELRTGTQQRIIVMLPEKQDQINLILELDTEGDIRADLSRRSAVNASRGNKAFIFTSADTKKGVYYDGSDDVYYSNVRGVQAHTGILVDENYTRWHRAHCEYARIAVRLGSDPKVISLSLHLTSAS